MDKVQNRSHENEFHFHENKTRFHINGFAFSLALKQRLRATKYRQFNRSYSRYPPSLHALKDWWDKSDVTCFLKGQTADKICQCKKSPSSLFILNNRKWRTFYLKDDNGKLWVKVIIVTFLDAVTTVDVLTASYNDVNLSKLSMTIKSSCSF